MHRTSDSRGLDLRVFGNGPLIQLIDRVAPQCEPAQELAGAERMTVMHGLMRPHGATVIEPGAEEDGLPNVTHEREVRFEAADPDLREWLYKDVVDEYLAVEATQQRLHVAPARQIYQRAVDCSCVHVVTPAARLTANEISRPTFASSRPT
jgi:hypothetical protein